MKQHTTTAILSILAFGFTACKEQQTTTGTTTPPSAADTAALDKFFVTEAPADPAEIHTLRETAKPGDSITIQGLVMGRVAPFVEGRAAFVLGDRTLLTPCNERGPEDKCATPWDTCCDGETIPKATATIQLLDANGRVLKQAIKGAHGLVELSAVVLTGTVDKSSTPEAFIINATSLYVTPPKAR